MANGTAQSSITMRKDAWWVGPLVTATILTVFGIYSTWRAFANVDFLVEPYISPFYSPYILASWWPLSPALLILWAPLGFRATCYYYRKAYYRSFFMAPPGCAVRPLAKEGSYVGETKFPFILQNLHRYFFYAATVILLFLWIDALYAFKFEDGFGIGVGTIILILNAAFLSMYSFSCHSFRHIVGGKLDVFSKCPTRFRIWGRVSVWNEHHMSWAWVSLFSVALADLYILLLAKGIITDIRII
ncbi:MAG: succinate dehydrogenase [Candidatus Dadabacteria bacterium]|nr:succinate dehydrogenase [Candidatus Dadabacteria bacterium]